MIWSATRAGVSPNFGYRRTAPAVTPSMTRSLSKMIVGRIAITVAANASGWFRRVRREEEPHSDLDRMRAP
jgi:hypothetical protein